MIELAQNITRSDIIIVATLLLIIVALCVVLVATTKEPRQRLRKRIGRVAQGISAEAKWRRWQWERIRYPPQGNKFVRRPKGNGIEQKMQRHYTEEDYEPRDFALPQLTMRELLAKDIERNKGQEKKPKRKKGGSVPPPSENDIPVDTGNYDIGQNVDFDFNAAFNLEPSAENSNEQRG